MSEGGDVLALSGVTRIFAQGGGRLEVIHDASFAIRRGEMVALVGPSGSGKSTLLHIVGLLERPSAGSIELTGRAVVGLADAARTALRRSALGFVYQYHHLLPEFSALENVVLPQMIAGRPRREARQRGLELLQRVGLSARASHRPARLSGGEQQRCWPTSRPAISIIAPPTRPSRCLPSWCAARGWRRSSPRTISISPAAWTAR